MITFGCVRHGARALGFSGWLAALHSDKYSSLKTLDASQTGSTTGLYSTNSRIWGTDIPEEPLLGPVPFSTRSGLTEVICARSGGRQFAEG